MLNIISYSVKKVIETIADILLPKERHIKGLESLGPDGLCEKLPRAENFDLTTPEGLEKNSLKAMFCYKNKLCRQAIWEIKFRANQKLIQDFSLLLYDYILDEIGDLKTFNNFKNIILIPIPSSKARRREKGFNQCVLICQELIKIDKERNQNTFTLVKNLLIKNIHTSRQTKVLNRKKRLENLKDSFTVSPSVIPLQNGIHLSSCSIILIDDVITTGATMRESVRALKKAGAHKIVGFSLAH
jgi:ComF family protein